MSSFGMTTTTKRHSVVFRRYISYRKHSCCWSNILLTGTTIEKEIKAHFSRAQLIFLPLSRGGINDLTFGWSGCSTVVWTRCF